jgi:hypothetical protein
MNLYAFVRNNGVNRFDVLGLDEFDPIDTVEGRATNFRPTNYRPTFGTHAGGISTQFFMAGTVTVVHSGWDTVNPDGSRGAGILGTPATAEVAQRNSQNNPARNREPQNSQPNDQAGSEVIMVNGDEVIPTVRLGELVVHSEVPEYYNEPTAVAAYTRESTAQNWRDANPTAAVNADFDNAGRYTPTSQDLFRAIGNDFSRMGIGGAPMAAARGGAALTVMVGTGFAGRAVIVAAPVLAKNLHFDGPQRGSRIAQIRYGSTPLVRLDYGRYPGSGGEPRLHLNFGPGKDNFHLSIDPRSLFDRGPGGP